MGENKQAFFGLTGIITVSIAFLAFRATLGLIEIYVYAGFLAYAWQTLIMPSMGIGLAFTQLQIFALLFFANSVMSLVNPQRFTHTLLSELSKRLLAKESQTALDVAVMGQTTIASLLRITLGLLVANIFLAIVTRIVLG